jgi:hypothetical protein
MIDAGVGVNVRGMLMIGLLQVSAVWVCTPSFVTYTARLAREIVTWVLF